LPITAEGAVPTAAAPTGGPEAAQNANAGFNDDVWIPVIVGITLLGLIFAVVLVSYKRRQAQRQIYEFAANSAPLRVRTETITMAVNIGSTAKEIENSLETVRHLRVKKLPAGCEFPPSSLLNRTGTCNLIYYGKFQPHIWDR